MGEGIPTEDITVLLWPWGEKQERGIWTQVFIVSFGQTI